MECEVCSPPRLSPAIFDYLLLVHQQTSICVRQCLLPNVVQFKCFCLYAHTHTHFAWFLVALAIVTALIDHWRAFRAFGSTFISTEIGCFLLTFASADKYVRGLLELDWLKTLSTMGWLGLSTEENSVDAYRIDTRALSSVSAATAIHRLLEYDEAKNTQRMCSCGINGRTVPLNVHLATEFGSLCVQRIHTMWVKWLMGWVGFVRTFWVLFCERDIGTELDSKAEYCWKGQKSQKIIGKIDIFSRIDKNSWKMENFEKIVEFTHFRRSWPQPNPDSEWKFKTNWVKLGNGKPKTLTAHLWRLTLRPNLSDSHLYSKQSS